MGEFDPVSYAMGVKSAGGGGGSSTLAGLSDVNISNPTDGQTLVFNATSGKWENGEGSSGGVLAITLDDTMTMNRTWNEIKNASFAVIIANFDEGSALWIPVTGCNTVTEGGSAYYVYGVQIFSAGEIEPITFSVDSPSGYPTLLTEPEP